MTDFYSIFNANLINWIIIILIELKLNLVKLNFIKIKLS